MKVFVDNKKRIVILPVALIFVLVLQIQGWADSIIVDHTSTNIHSIPQTAIEQAKANLVIAYGHTSHGSQITTGMSGLVGFMNGLGYPTDLYAYNSTGSGDALQLRDSPFSGASDLGNPDRTAWEAATRTYLNANPDVNVIIWSWCGQADTSEENIQQYLDLMNGLENDYSGVKFVYMTGHLVGTGETGNLNLRNQQIRDYCTANGKILYDFADIESYDPDGLVNYMVLLCNDGCYYDSDGNGSLDSNWAINWQNSHTENTDWYSCSSAHSQSLNANLKAYAAWWLWARLGGWGECTNAPSSLTATADSNLAQIELNWTDNSDNEDYFIIQRQIDEGTWDNAYSTTTSDVTTFTDSMLSPGTYKYRVIAHRNNDGTGNPCDSGPSNTATAEIINTALPAAPTDLTITGDAIAGTAQLTWSDNSDNEDEFIIQRQVDGGAWNDTFDSVNENTTLYMDTGLTSGAYAYRVVAANSSGISNPTDTVTVNIVQSAPVAPSDLTSSVNGFDIILSWIDNSDNEDGFVIERSIDSGSFVTLTDSLASDSETYTDTSLTPLHTYTYQVKAVNSFGDSGFSNQTSQYMYNETNTIILNDDDAGEIIDAFLLSANPDTNYGSTSYLTSYDRFIVQFNLPSELMNKKIVSAELSFYVWAVDPDDAGTRLNLYRVTTAWNESSVTWNTPWNVGGGDIAESVGQITVENIDHAFLTPIDITEVVQHWVDNDVSNYGLILDKPSDVGMGIKASEYSQSASPYLEITYTNKICTDFDTDGDVDGADLYELKSNFEESCVGDFAAGFGH